MWGTRGREGRGVEGALPPAPDLAARGALSRAGRGVGGVVHPHPRHATAWAQAGREIPCFGTTHADYFHGPVPVTKPLTPKEIRADYEENTGLAILKRFRKLEPLKFPAVLRAEHGPF